MRNSMETIYLHGTLLLCIVQAGNGEPLVAHTKGAGAQGGTILLGKGVADRAILHMLGLGDTKKEITLTILTESQTDTVWESLSHFKRDKRLACGIAMLIDVPNVLRHVAQPSQGTMDSRSIPMDSPHTLITCIVNKGTADEVMDVARKAGATGGTILNARGTGKEEDVKFFGVRLVPEKEMLLMLVGSGQTGKVLDAIRTVPCLAEPGSGIAFCIDVERFMTLGGKLPQN